MKLMLVIDFFIFLKKIFRSRLTSFVRFFSNRSTKFLFVFNDPDGPLNTSTLIARILLKFEKGSVLVKSMLDYFISSFYQKKEKTLFLRSANFFPVDFLIDLENQDFLIADAENEETGTNFVTQEFLTESLKSFSDTLVSAIVENIENSKSLSDWVDHLRELNKAAEANVVTANENIKRANENAKINQDWIFNNFNETNQEMLNRLDL